MSNTAERTFEEIPDNLRNKFYEDIIADVECPQSMRDPDNNYGARTLAIFITKKRTHHLWVNLNIIMETLKNNDVSNNEVQQIYRVICKHLINMQ